MERKDSCPAFSINVATKKNPNKTRLFAEKLLDQMPHYHKGLYFAKELLRRKEYWQKENLNAQEEVQVGNQYLSAGVQLIFWVGQFFLWDCPFNCWMFSIPGSLSLNVFTLQSVWQRNFHTISPRRESEIELETQEYFSVPYNAEHITFVFCFYFCFHSFVLENYLRMPMLYIIEVSFQWINVEN